MSTLQIQEVLSQMRALQARASGVADTSGIQPLGGGVQPSGGAQPVDFATVLKGTVDNIASMQNQATSLAQSYEAGDKSVDITKVMLEVQKASLAFHAMTEVRNKLVDAYTQVMNMSV
jgi:flagellar hook-basal body complex protein FliE